jgi:TMEM175 potassium channel family protein
MLVTRGRLEAFSDGVLAILITIMVLELRIPHGADWAALREMAPEFFAYLVSFIYLGIYWTNHHHLFQLVDRVSGGILWSNLHLLFWLSLLPAATAWVGKNPTAPLPTAVYGMVFLLSACAWLVLQATIIRHQGPKSKLRAAVQEDAKGKISFGLYALGVWLSFIKPWLGQAVYVIVALLWLVPDRRIEAQVD